jgi:hypothetical protein
MVDQRDVLAREVDEELRREQLMKLWEKYGTYVVGAVVLIIVGVGGWKFYEGQRIRSQQTAGTQFSLGVREAAKADAKADAPNALDEIAKTGPEGYATLARLRLAAADKTAGKTADALAKYEAVAKDRRADPLLVDYARLQAAMLTLDGGNWTDIQNRLTPLTADSNAWRYSAREALGVAAMKAGKPVEARQEFEKLLGDRNVPPGVGERARLMMVMLTEAELAKSAAPAAEPAKAAPAAPGAKSEPKAK